MHADLWTFIFLGFAVAAAIGWSATSLALLRLLVRQKREPVDAAEPAAPEPTHDEPVKLPAPQQLSISTPKRERPIDNTRTPEQFKRLILRSLPQDNSDMVVQDLHDIVGVNYKNSNNEYSRFYAAMEQLVAAGYVIRVKMGVYRLAVGVNPNGRIGQRRRRHNKPPHPNRQHEIETALMRYGDWISVEDLMVLCGYPADAQDAVVTALSTLFRKGVVAKRGRQGARRYKYNATP